MAAVAAISFEDRAPTVTGLLTQSPIRVLAARISDKSANLGKPMF